MAVTVCSSIVFVVLALTLTTNGFPYLNGDPSDHFYNTLRKLIIEKVHALKEKTDHNNVQPPPKPVEIPNWPKSPLKVGQISGVSVNSKNQPVIFHRANVVWGAESFDPFTNRYLKYNDGPIKEDPILILDPEDGKVIHSWGANFFYMPHGITIDIHDNYWLTDVALHQVFKFHPGSSTPALDFGEPFQPGSGIRNLCKPTSVAVATTGEIFIADGYCNNRVLKFNAAGGLLRIIPNPAEFLSLLVPHGLALLESQDRICIADRENMRVTCPRAGLHTLDAAEDATLTISEPDLGRVFDIAARGDFLYAVNGPTSRMIGVMGFTIDPISESIIDHWTPTSQKLQNPHAIAVNANGTHLYISEINPNRLWKFSLTS